MVQRTACLCVRFVSEMWFGAIFVQIVVYTCLETLGLMVLLPSGLCSSVCVFHFI